MEGTVFTTLMPVSLSPASGIGYALMCSNQTTGLATVASEFEVLASSQKNLETVTGRILILRDKHAPQIEWAIHR